MRKFIFSFIIFFLIIFIKPTYAVQYISSCGELAISDTYILTADIIDSTNITCFSITANNVVLDCQNHVIKYLQDVNYPNPDSTGVYIGVVNNVSISNCILIDWGTGIMIRGNSSLTASNNILSNITIYSTLEYEPTYHYYLVEQSVMLKYTNNILIEGFKVFNVTNGIWIGSEENVVVRNSIFNNIPYYAIEVYTDSAEYISIYNNIFNDSGIRLDCGYCWQNNRIFINTTKQSGANIWNSSLGYIGGNLWTTSSNNGYSDICVDADYDGFCDQPYKIVASGPLGSFSFYDYLPIAKQVGQHLPIIESIYTYDGNYNPIKEGRNGKKVIFRVNIIDSSGRDYLTNNVIELRRPDGSIVVNNATMSWIAIISNGYTFEYSFTPDTTGLWLIKVYSKDSLSNFEANNSAMLFVGSPRWSDMITFNSTPYSQSIFNITWNDSIGYSIDTVLLEGNFSGVPQNYTMFLLDPYINVTEKKGVYSFNISLAPGTYYWKSYAKASDGVWNVSDTVVFTIGIYYISSCQELNITNGTYYLTQDIVNSSGSVCIYISANNIILDCQGHIIDGVSASGSRGIDIGSRKSNVNITNCIIRDWDLGIYLEPYYSENLTLINNTITSNYIGVNLYQLEFANIINNTFYQNARAGLYFSSGCELNIHNNIFRDNNYGIEFFQVPDCGIRGDNPLMPGYIYNNIFNNTNNVYIDDISTANYYYYYWNVTKQTGINIWNSSLGYIGGNLWTNSNNNGYSDTCNDVNGDGFCDNPYTIAINNYDYLPLAKVVGQVFNLPPRWRNNIYPPSPQSWLANLSFQIEWYDDLDSNGFSYSYFEHNFTSTGVFVNTTALRNGNISYFNITGGSVRSGVYCFRWYAKDSLDFWNATDLYCLTITQAWNQTNNVIADEEYEYDLGKKGIPIHTNLISITPLNSTVKVGDFVYAYYNLSIFNNNNNTGLTDTFTNIYVNLSKYINMSIWQNVSTLEKIIPSLPHNSQTFIKVDVKNITAIQKDYGCRYTDYLSFRKYECNFIVSVLENNVTPNLPIIYEIPYNLLPDWDRRDKTATNWFVDGTTKNITYEEVDSLGKVRFYVDIYHSNSSLDAGDHTFTIIYYIPTVYSGGGGGGGGGGGYVPKVNISFDVAPLLISKFVEAGENKPIIATVEGYTFLIKNDGPNPIFINIRIEGDYKDWVTLTSISKMQVYQQPQYIVVDPGKTVGVKLYTNIPLNVEVGTYSVTVIFQDRDSGVYKTATINLVVSPAGTFYKYISGFASAIGKVVSYPIIFSPNNNFNITKDGIYMRGMSEVSVPIGWLFALLSFIIPSILTSNILRLRYSGRLKESYKRLVVYVVGIVGLLLFVVFLVGWVG